MAEVQEGNGSHSWNRLLRNIPDSSDALRRPCLQLAVAEEFAGNDRQGQLGWYRQISSTSDADELLKRKAQGSPVVGSNSVGKPIRLQGTKGHRVASRPLDLAAIDEARLSSSTIGPPGVEPCKEDIKALRELRSRYGNRGFECVGINSGQRPKRGSRPSFGKTRSSGRKYTSRGGLDSRLAVDFGVFTLPTMLLIDQQG